ncbi:MAG: division/cell wall cluster transcriptional repressor MraZ [Clostridia bacterium]
MLYGEYQHNMDLKGRVTVPSKFRDDLGDKFFVCKGLDDCLFLLSESKWQEMVEKVAAMPVSQTRNIQRYFFSGASDIEPDKQGRILIPQTLREYAGLSKEITVIGTGTRAEIWDTAKWKTYNENLTGESLEGAMEALGI